MAPPIRKHQNRPARNGFSLVEAMVAIGIFSLVLLLLANGMWSGARFLTANSASSDALGAKLAARSVIEETLGSAVVSSIDARTPVLEFTGSSSAVRFFSLNKRVNQSARTEQVSFRILNGGGLGSEAAIQVDIRAYDAVNGRLGKRRSSQIQVPAKQFDFFNPRARGDYERGWIREWPFVNELPAAVRVRMNEGPPIFAKPYTQMDIACVQERGNEGLSGRFCAVRQ